jgi:MHS family proline/betaine transporter-like MFS transporter
MTEPEKTPANGNEAPEGFAATMARLIWRKTPKGGPPGADAPTLLRRSIVGGTVGNILEWYDFAVFGYFAPIIATQFFPTRDRIVSLLGTFGVFAVAYFMRPLGGALFGHIGDRFGRKRALQISVMMMAVPTFLIGVLPNYQSFGVRATVLLLLCRLVQGLSVGGELVGSISFLSEVAPPGRRGFVGSFANAGAIGGIMLGSLVATVLTGTLGRAALESWGWRLPFLAGIGIAFVSLWMRKALPETADFESMKAKDEISPRPVTTVLRTMPLRIVHMAALVSLSGGGFYLLFVWWPTLMSDLFHPPIRHSLLVNTLSMAMLVLLIPVTGHLSDRVGRRPMLIAGALGILLTDWPLFPLVDHRTFATALMAQLTFAVVIGLFMGPIPAMLAEMFPARTRFSGIAMGYNISLAALGGTAPLVATWLFTRYASVHAPALYLMFLAALSLGAAWLIPRTSPSADPSASD